MNNTAENEFFFGFAKVKWLQYTGIRWANVQAIDVKYSQTKNH